VEQRQTVAPDVVFWMNMSRPTPPLGAYVPGRAVPGEVTNVVADNKTDTVTSALTDLPVVLVDLQRTEPDHASPIAWTHQVPRCARLWRLLERLVQVHRDLDVVQGNSFRSRRPPRLAPRCTPSSRARPRRVLSAPTPRTAWKVVDGPFQLTQYDERMRAT